MDGKPRALEWALEGPFALFPNLLSNGSHLENTLVLGCGLALDEVVAPRMLALGGELVLAELEFPSTSLPLAQPGLVVGSVLLHAV